MSPSANTLPSTVSWDSGCSASKATVWASAPRERSCVAAASRAGDGRPASHTVRVRRTTRRRAVASAISDVPPRTSRDWGMPKASFTNSSLEGLGSSEGLEGQTAGQVRGEHPARVQLGGQRTEVVGARVHRGEQFWPQTGVLGQAGPPACHGHLLVQFVEEGAETGQAGRDVQGQGPAGHREGEPSG